MKQLKLFAVIMVIILASCSKEEPIIDSQKSNESQIKSLTHPFAASGQYTNKLSSGDCAGYLRANASGEGQSISIGDFALNGGYCFGNCSESDPLSLSISNSSWTFIVSNGDKLTLTYSDACFELRTDLVNPYGDGPVLVYESSYMIVGGTGMYHGTTGSGTLQIIQYPGAGNSESGSSQIGGQPGVVSLLGISEFSLNGTIKYPYDIIHHSSQNEN